ncbi:thiolase family protein [Deinococcus maricopensis]|uniref:Acetyl-CoA acetyltransferase n=1 Tax=Deinococcus maricopensis (strain DSM 21211 / LMG 22137 / NRRL B-23946 / LB-34) TaxID=709986 RepID=E8U557_DEIML|nr:thiolase family protein [Deinococcus maricopensis]ADV66196.1 acetyl-CoA acetyltransferase [Deinococcus maricopensis DSM 21211]
MNSVVLVAGARTAVGAMGGAFRDTPDYELGQVALTGALERAGVRADALDLLVMGQVLTAGEAAYNPRRIGLSVGMREVTPQYGVNQLCGSGLRAAYNAWMSLALGEVRLVAAGGVENMSRAPYLLPEARFGKKLGHMAMVDSLTKALTCGVTDVPMGITAENIAERQGLTREAQDAFSVESHRRALAAQASGRLAREIVPVQTKKGLVDTDERPQETSLEALGKLKPAFRKDGTVTAGNASGINDGAAFMILADEAYARAEGLPILARLRGFTSAGVAPDVMGLGPSIAVPKLLDAHGLSVPDIGVWELNEAFAAQALGVMNDLKLPEDRVNLNGGAVALGHPVGMSGARVLYSLVEELRDRGGLGVATLCIGGGQGIAALVEAV